MEAESSSNESSYHESNTDERQDEILPYMYEPEDSDTENSDQDSEDADEDPEDPEGRLVNNSW